MIRIEGSIEGSKGRLDPLGGDAVGESDRIAVRIEADAGEHGAHAANHHEARNLGVLQPKRAVFWLIRRCDDVAEDLGEFGFGKVLG